MMVREENDYYRERCKELVTAMGRLCTEIEDREEDGGLAREPDGPVCDAIKQARERVPNRGTRQAIGFAGELSIARTISWPAAPHEHFLAFRLIDSWSLLICNTTSACAVSGTANHAIGAAASGSILAR